ncbi:asparagine synthase (glutamine-hydrolyzing) [Alkalinema sp. FACHB-956]|uniref:asparagine synthase (glutamine-hydrolyzing) n=1 Tax=Alkalinema sp. FACHB-956 TaxID=2692768 RepID=UPI001687BE9F|nr:asparagine synthase (glutamine-hydrolyzing) [Alkalinema sp. FACHB-956]MBD2329612.1 asparagine synthase (glutamine-hydrolyzing) [Alkalinema sp. FACHB-956]
MCGIIGLIGTSSRTSLAQIEVARDRMWERGPDDAGLHQMGQAIFGFRRLAILDLSPAGHQPMVSSDGQVMLVFNGEIYNYQELRNQLKADYPFRSGTDTEVILNGYLAWGWERMLDRIDGMFAIAIWDNRTQTLYGARDRVGKKPFFYHYEDGTFSFASTLNSLRALLPQTPNVNPIALDAYLTYQAVPAPYSIFQGIHQLPPAHYLRYHYPTQKLSLERYWDVDYSQKTKQSEAEILEELDHLIRQAVRRRLMSDVPLGAFLSGGVDSSLVVAMMAQERQEPVDAVVIGFEDQAFDERNYARKVAQHLGHQVNLHEYVLQPDFLFKLPEIIGQYGQPLADVSIVPTYYVAKAAREHVTVALNGDGGDEVFAGYSRPVIARAAESYRRFLPPALRSALGQIFTDIQQGSLKNLGMLAQTGKTTAEAAFIYDRAFRSYRHQIYTPEFRQQLGNYHPDLLYSQVWNRARATDDVDRALYGDFSTYLPDQLLTKMDVSTMAFSLEARSPLLDKTLIEYSARIPTDLRIKGFTTKYLLKRLATRYVPAEVIYRRKRGFVMPASAWLTGHLANYLKVTLRSSAFQDRGWFEPTAIEQMLQEHFSGQVDWGQQLWTLLVLEIWAGMTLDRSFSNQDSLQVEI